MAWSFTNQDVSLASAQEEDGLWVTQGTNKGICSSLFHRTETVFSRLLQRLHERPPRGGSAGEDLQPFLTLQEKLSFISCTTQQDEHQQLNTNHSVELFTFQSNDFKAGGHNFWFKVKLWWAFCSTCTHNESVALELARYLWNFEKSFQSLLKRV